MALFDEGASDHANEAVFKRLFFTRICVGCNTEHCEGHDGDSHERFRHIQHDFAITLEAATLPRFAAYVNIEGVFCRLRLDR